MTLELPQDAEKFIPEGGDLSDLHGPGCYALRLDRPDDLASAWDREFDTRPDYFAELRDADTCLYVGASGDVLRRLEEHRDGEVRVGVLQRVCEIDSLRNIWWADDKEEAFQEESRLAIMLSNQYPDAYVHSR